MLRMIETLLADRYRVLSKLGSGTMGEVFLVEHVHLGRKEALKVVKAELLEDEEMVARFRREARATNRVQHPNVVSVYDFGRLSDGRFFLSMEYVNGESLRHILQRERRFPLPRAIRVLEQLAEAIEHAHQQGVIHRDLKPENLLLTKHRGISDVLKVLDFGIAKIIGPDQQEALEISRTGEVLGTVFYLAPEMLAGKTGGPPQDIYAFGCIAFELVVGEPPFVGTMFEVMEAHLDDVPEKPSELRRRWTIPHEFDQLVARCLQKKPEARFQTATELLAAVRAVPLPGALDSDEAPTQITLDSFGDRGTDASGGFGLLSTKTDIIMVRKRYRELLQTIGELLLDLGPDKVDLNLGVANAKTRYAHLSNLEAEMARNRQRAVELERSARNREGSLRFTLGELEFARAEMARRGESVPGSLVEHIREIEQHLISESRGLEDQLRDLDEGALALAIRAASAEDLAQPVLEHLATILFREGSECESKELVPLLAELKRIHARVTTIR